MNFNLDHLLYPHLCEYSFVSLVEPFEFDGGELGEGELAGLIVAVNAVIIRFDFFEIA